MKKKIKILHLTFDMAIGGTEQVIRQLVENTDMDKFDVSILCIDNKIGDIGQQLLKQGIKIISLNRQPGFDTHLIKEIRQIIRLEQVNVLHCHQYSPYVYGVLAAFMTQVKVIFTEHGRFYPDSSSWKRRLINPLLAHITNQITSISKATKQALIDFEFLPADKIKIIYNGIANLSNQKYDQQAIKKELGISSDELVLGTISRLDPIKNHKMLFSAFKEINDKIPETRLLIIGDGPLRQELEQQCRELEIIEKVIFTGFKVKPQQFLKCMDIFLLPSFSEGTSMTLLEAMSFSKPCIVTNVGGNPEIVIDGKTGLVTANDDKNALIKACLQLLKSRHLQYQYGKAGKERFLDKFIVQKMVDQFQFLYQDLGSDNIR